MQNALFRAMILFILLVSFALRVYALDSYPPAISNDEAVNAIDVFHIAQTGNFPMYEEDGGRPEPLHRILLALGVAGWGSSVWGMRLFSALMGTITVAAVGWLTYESLADWRPSARRVAILVTMIALTVMLGHITLSRSLYRAVIQLPIIAISMAFVLRGLRLGNWRDFALSGFFGGLSLYTYTAAFVYPPAYAVLGLTLLLFHRDQWRRWFTGLVIVAVVALIVISPILYLLVTQPSAVLARAGDVAATESNWRRTLEIAAGQFYALGDENPQYNVALAPIISPFWWPIFLLGLLTLIMRVRTHAALFILSLLLLFNIPVIATDEITHGLRIASEYIIVTPIIGIGAGMIVQLLANYRTQWTNSRWFTGSVALVLSAILVVQSSAAWRTYEDYWLYPERWKQWEIFGYTLDHNEWFFRTDRRDFAAWVSQQETPLLMPLAELQQQTTRTWLMGAYPQVRTAGGDYQLPAGTRLVLPYTLAYNDFLSDTRHFVVLHEGATTLLPPIDDTTHAQLMATRDDADIITREGVKLNQMAQVSAVPDDLALSFPQPHSADAPFATFNDDELHMTQWYGSDTYEGENSLDITLVWEAQRRIGHEYASFLQLQTADYQRLAGSEALIHRWLYPSSVWQMGDQVPDTHTLALPDDLSAGAYRLSLGLYYSDLPPIAANSLIFSDLPQMATIGWYKVPQAETATIPADATPIDATYGEGFTLEAARIVRGDDGLVYVALYWRSQVQRPALDATIFVHFVDEENQIVAQNDSRPWNGQYPTFIWDDGEQVETLHPLSGEGYELDDVTLRVGMYTFPGPQNLAVTANTITHADGLLNFGTVSSFVAD